MIRSCYGQLNTATTRSTLRGISSLQSTLLRFQLTLLQSQLFTGALQRLGVVVHHSQWLKTAYKEAR